MKIDGIIEKFLHFSEFFCCFFLNLRQVSYPIMTCPLFCERFIALIAKELYSAVCFFVLLKKLIKFF